MGIKMTPRLRDILKPRFHLFSAVAGLTFFAGCSVSPPGGRMATVASMAPDSWNASREARAGIDDDWIARFGDKQLSSLVDEAMQGNFDLQVAAERIRRAESVARLAGAPARPQLDAQLSGLRQKQRFVGLPFGGDAQSNNFGASLNVNWELDVWGRVRAGQRAAVADLQAREFDYKAGMTSLAAQLAKAWFALGETNDQIALAEEAVSIRDTVATAFQERFESALNEDGGLGTQIRLAQSDLESSKATLALWQGERERALRQIELLLGRYPSGKNLTNRGLPSPPPSPPSGLPSELLKRRPDVLAAERRFAGAGQRAKEARLARFPRLSLTASTGTVTDSLDNVLDSSFGVWSIGGGLVQPILTGGRLKEEELIARSDERIALGDLQNTVLQAFGEVEQALVAEKYLTKRVGALAKSAERAASASLASAQDFADGNVDALTLLTAQDRRIQTALLLANLRRIRLDNRVDLHLALGGDFRVRGK